jgi:heme A synthase
MPFGQSRLADIHLTHRAFMYLAVVLVLAAALLALRRRPGREAVRYAWAAIAVLLAQVLLGAVNVWVPEEYELLVLAHLAMGTLLWTAVVGLGLALRPAAAGAAAAVGRGERGEGAEGTAPGTPVTA